MNTSFSTLQDIISRRRTIKPDQMNGQKIEEAKINELVQLADWAPTHGRTEPWRFYTYGSDKVTIFCKDHAELYRSHTPAENFQQGTYDKLLHMGDQASHVLVAVMQRGDNPKIPVLEEVAATAAAIQNLLLGAEALGIAAYWGSGGMAYKPAMKIYLNLVEEDTVLGVLYLGYTDAPAKAGVRKTPAASKLIRM